MTIGEVARTSGLRPSAIRFYERAGLLPPPERHSGRRAYDETVLQRLRVIELCKRAGFSLKEVERLLSGFDPETPPSKRWRELAIVKLEELDQMVDQIEGMRALLRKGLECDCLRLEDCSLIEPDGDRADERRRAA